MVMKMYVCGPTLYSDIHIGNARPLVFFDVVAEYHRRQGHGIVYARNITDVDDKIVQFSKDKHPGYWVVQNTEKNFREMETYLGTKRPSVEPRASMCITWMIGLIEILLSKGNAIVKSDGVYMNYSGPLYGTVSNRPDLHADFVLWKLIDDGTFTWDSPWGKGRPGWHTECAAMIGGIFGKRGVDIHGGGTDLTFPHHENENIQHVCSCENRITRKWIRNSHLLVDGKKMSKSKGNFVTVKEVSKDWSGKALRHFLLKSRYNKPINFTFKELAESEKIVTKRPHAALDTNSEWSDDQMLALSKDYNTALATMTKE